ncbi:MAG: DUF4372 domain-containing protein [Prevotellaceae bacterium]|jgi:hypothetical protein|nr:DUF4372 domain-containing protein [Prevotellaceae bacterium]
MYSGKYVFAQLLPFLDRYEFKKCVKRFDKTPIKQLLKQNTDFKFNQNVKEQLNLFS